MLGAIATATRVGISFERTPLKELAHRLGKPVAVLTGVTVFLIATCFQFSNNLGVLAAVEPLFPMSSTSRIVVLVGLNGLIIAGLLGLKKLYSRVEHLMMFLMGMMLLGFLANLILARPDLLQLLSGFVPNFPAEMSGSFVPRMEAGVAKDAKPMLVDPWIAVQGLIVTSFSIAGAFYQAYLVREKGWTLDSANRGLMDSIVGTGVLIGITLMIMSTAATVLKGTIAPNDLESASDVAVQLEPLFGSAAKWLFCIGIFAGAISSFLVNSILGGTFMADGLGQDASIDSKWTKVFTIASLMIGMCVALMTTAEGRVPLIIFAQALTVLGGPILVGSLLYLATRKLDGGSRAASGWMIVVTALGGFVVLALAARTLVRIYLTSST